MKEKQQHEQWLDDIRNEMQDFEAPIPADGWERVSSSLPPAPKPMIGRRWMGVAASVMICAILGGGYYLVGDEQVDECVVAEERMVSENVLAEEPEVVSVVPEDDISQDKEQEHVPQVSDKVKTNPTIKGVISEESHITEKAEPVNITEITEPTPECEEPPVLHKDTIVHSLAREEEKVLLAMNDVRKKESATWSYGLHIGGHGSLFDDEMSEGLIYADDPSHSDPSVNDDPTIGTPPGTTIPALPDDVIDSKNHSTWSFGLSIDRQVWHRTTLESGLVYTLLTSDVKMRYSGNKSQRIHYLGIPVKLNYYIIGNQQCQLYASGGVMLERALTAIRDGERIDVKPWQWSSNLAIGGQFRISRHLSLYLEPGANWYFNSDSSVPSLRSESPVYFNLRGGIRLHR